MKANIHEAEQNAIGISHIIFQNDTEMHFTSTINGKKTMHVEPKDFAIIDELMVSFLHPLNIYKIKIFSTDKKIVYSTDHRIIGQTNTGNEKLNRALRGEVVSKLEKKDKVWDIAGEQQFDIDLVESYLPVMDENNEVIGSFELYLDISRQHRSVSRALNVSFIITSIVICFVIGIIHIRMRLAMNEWKKTQ